MQRRQFFSTTFFIFSCLFIAFGCQDQGQAGSHSDQDSTILNNGESIVADTIAILPAPEAGITLTFKAGTVAPGSAFHVFNCYDIEVLEGEFDVEKDIDYKNFEMTVMYADTAFARMMHYNEDTLRQKARFVKGESKVPRKKMLISGFVDDHMQAWLLRDLEIIPVPKNNIPRERP